ncbi:MAG: ABC transporter permease [Cyanobacteria bacterium REEB67]|nr:ABC transporter permease [Cyanobacteria bacterium REEB67]
MSLTSVAKRLPGVDLILWLAPLGRATRYLGLTLLSLPRWRFRHEMRAIFQWMGPQSFHLVALAAVVVAIALTMQCVVELEKYQAQDLAGAVISLGLLREVGPLTVSLAWCARVAAMVADQAQQYDCDNPGASDSDYAADFIAPRLMAALLMSIPLGGYGLAIGFITGALATPLLTVSTTQQFLECAREAITVKDLTVYFIKLILVNPPIAIFAGCVAGRLAAGNKNGAAYSVAARAVTALFICGFVANLIVSLLAYLN